MTSSTNSLAHSLKTRLIAEQTTLWPTIYRNRDTGRYYAPHHAMEARFVYRDTPRYVACLGGEGSGKSVAGCIKTLERVRRGMSGILVSPDLEHFKKSLWREFSAWCPWHMVLPRLRYMGEVGWQPSEPFVITFVNGAQLLCGGIKEDQVGSWEGPNVHFAHFDEARRHKTAAALKVLTGRVRLQGPNGEPPQLYLTSTPRKHWLYEYFGPWEKPNEVDPFAEFKKRAGVVRLRTDENAAALDPEYVAARRSSLTESEARIVLEAEWEDERDTESFLPSMLLWDNCLADLPALTPTNSPTLVLGVDAAVGRSTGPSDYFALSLVSRHWDRLQRSTFVVWDVIGEQAQAGHSIDQQAMEDRILDLCRRFRVQAVAYDPFQLVHMAQRLEARGIYCRPVGQASEQIEADTLLLESIMGKRIIHGGNPMLRDHIANADRKLMDSTEPGSLRKVRMVKRRESLKIDTGKATASALYVINEM